MLARAFGVAALVVITVGACQRSGGRVTPTSKQSLVEARKGFQTVLVRKESAGVPLDEPPPDVFRAVKYQSPAGKLWAYVTPSPGDGAKHPAIVWITGGDSNTIGDVWSDRDPDNDQSAAAYREAGIVMMFPSLRGGNDNPGVREGFYGELQDIVAARDYLAKLDYVDPERIYLGGHSTGGTTALLVAEISDQFRAVFAFGPVADVTGYGETFCPFDMSSKKEIRLRAPSLWLRFIKSPTFIFEGAERGNLESLMEMKALNKNPVVHFRPVAGGDHFNILAPINTLIANRIAKASRERGVVVISNTDVANAFAPRPAGTR